MSDPPKAKMVMGRTGFTAVGADVDSKNVLHGRRIRQPKTQGRMYANITKVKSPRVTTSNISFYGLRERLIVEFEQIRHNLNSVYFHPAYYRFKMLAEQLLGGKTSTQNSGVGL